MEHLQGQGSPAAPAPIGCARGTAAASGGAAAPGCARGSRKRLSGQARCPRTACADGRRAAPAAHGSGFPDRPGARARPVRTGGGLRPRLTEAAFRTGPVPAHGLCGRAAGCARGSLRNVRPGARASAAGAGTSLRHSIAPRTRRIAPLRPPQLRRRHQFRTAPRIPSLPRIQPRAVRRALPTA